VKKSPLSLLGLLLLVQGADCAVYFDINFSSPLHQVGSPPTFGTGPGTPTRNVFGTEQVVSGFGALADQPVVLNTAGNSPGFFYDQFSLSLGYNQDTYHISFDVYTEGLIGSLNQFSMIMDFKSVTSFILASSGKISPAFWGGPAGNPSYLDRHQMHVDISLNPRNNRGVTLLDGVLVGDGQIIGNSNPGDLQSVRFSLGLTGFGSIPDNRSYVALDNIVVTNGFVVPESGTPALALLSALFAMSFRGRSRSAGFRPARLVAIFRRTNRRAREVVARGSRPSKPSAG